MTTFLDGIGKNLVNLPRRLISPAHRNVGITVEHKIPAISFDPISVSQANPDRTNVWLEPGVVLPTSESFVFTWTAPQGATAIRSFSARAWEGTGSTTTLSLSRVTDAAAETVVATLNWSAEAAWTTKEVQMEEDILDNMYLLKCTLGANIATSGSRALWVKIRYTRPSLIRGP